MGLRKNLGVKSFWPRFRLAIVISFVYTIVGILYSFIGLLSPQPPISVLGYVRLNEVLVHMLFGFVVGIFSFDIMMALNAAAFAVLIDGGHFLPQFGVPVHPGVSHSLTFMILSAFVLGYIFRKKIGFSKMAAITAAAFLSHVAYDIIDGPPTAMLLLNPFSFEGILLPAWAVAPIEILGIAIVSFAFRDNILSFIKGIRR